MCENCGAEVIDNMCDDCGEIIKVTQSKMPEILSNETLRNLNKALDSNRIIRLNQEIYYITSKVKCSAQLLNQTDCNIDISDRCDFYGKNYSEIITKIKEQLPECLITIKIGSYLRSNNFIKQKVIDEIYLKVIGDLQENKFIGSMFSRSGIYL